MRTLTKSQESYFDGLRKVGDVPLKSALDAVHPPTYGDCVSYMKLVSEKGPDIGPNLLGAQVDAAQKEIFSAWWDATVDLGRSVLVSSYGDRVGGANVAAPRFAEALPSFPISELNQTRLLFHQYGSEIGGALILAALPQAYAT